MKPLRHGEEQVEGSIPIEAGIFIEDKKVSMK